MRFCFLCKWFGWYRWLCRGYNISWWSFTWDPRTFPARNWSTWWGPVTTIHNLCGFILDHYEHDFYHLCRLTMMLEQAVLLCITVYGHWNGKIQRGDDERQLYHSTIYPPHLLVLRRKELQGIDISRQQPAMTARTTQGQWWEFIYEWLSAILAVFECPISSKAQSNHAVESFPWLYENKQAQK